jgi:HD-GYP domain-containing protein (c-di-GMP phosphodiesterase class II)
MIAKELGMEGEVFQNLLDGALLHDLGKIGIREDVLNKVGKLTDDEYKHIQTHPDIGADIIGKMEAYRHLIPLVKHHHERFDGKGYPSGLAGEAIPIEARIIAVADTFDAMTSERPYREPRTHGEALRIMREVAGSQLDPRLVGVFLMLQGRLHDLSAVEGA